MWPSRPRLREVSCSRLGGGCVLRFIFSDFTGAIMRSLFSYRTLFPSFLFARFLGTILVILLPSCNRGGQNAGNAITVGVVLPITGREGKPGQYQKEGIELAIKQIN